MPKLKKEYIRLLASLSSLGIEMGVSVVIGYFMGKYLDKLFNTGKILTVTFIFLGCVAGFKSLYMLSKEVQKDIDEHRLDDVYEDNNKNDVNQKDEKEK